MLCIPRIPHRLGDKVFVQELESALDELLEGPDIVLVKWTLVREVNVALLIAVRSDTEPHNLADIPRGSGAFGAIIMFSFPVPISGSTVTTLLCLSNPISDLCISFQWEAEPDFGVGKRYILEEIDMHPLFVQNLIQSSESLFVS